MPKMPAEPQKVRRGKSRVGGVPYRFQREQSSVDNMLILDF